MRLPATGDLAIDVIRAHAYSNHWTLGEVLTQTKVGCFHCLRVFIGADIKEWCDDQMTAICPHCGIDSVLPDRFGFPIEQEFLSAMKAHWFQVLK